MKIFWFILSSIYFFLPAYFVNMTPPLVKRFKIFEKQVDFGKKFLGKPIFGAHKTWRGVIFGMLAGFLIVILQKILYDNFSFFQKISLINFSKINIFLFWFLISFGAIFGDLFFAFVKRRLDLVPGAPFLPFDQTNYVIGAWVFTGPFFDIEPKVWLCLFFLTFFLHLFFNYLGYLLGIHKAKL